MKSVRQIFIFSILKSFTAIVFPIATLFTTPAFSQFLEQFSDNELATNPTWTGTTDHFVVTDGQLQLKAPVGTTESYLSCEPGNFRAHTWEFTVRMLFNPSSTNFARIYLLSDNLDFSAPLNGYFVAVGSASDDISLYHQSGTARVKIVDGADGRLNANDNLFRIRVTRSEEGGWQLFSDTALSGVYTSEGSATHNEDQWGPYFGLQCIYTSTRSDKFFFDDVSISGDPVVDTTPPSVTSISASSAQSLKIIFNEPIENSTLTNVASFSVSNNVGNPWSIARQTASIITLHFENTFVPNLEYTLSLTGVKDLAGNALTNPALVFRYIERGQAKQKDVVFTELFPDPSPTVGLPEIEFVEVFNRSTTEFDLTGWILTDGSSKATIPSLTLQPGQYAVFVPKGSENRLDAPLVIGLASFPSLNNSRDMLKLSNAAKEMIDSLTYTDSWYRSTEKKTGGWTLEKIDPQNLCGDEENWVASESPSGGTPGFVNSVNAENPDLSPPSILASAAIAPDTVSLILTEKLEKNLPLKTNFSFDPILSINSVALSADLRQIKLHVTPTLSSGVLYQLNIDALYDCAGNKSTFDKIEIALPQEPDSLDVVINEILFNPRSGGSDFVELYNRSSKFIDITKLKLANLEGRNALNLKNIQGVVPLLKPGAFIAISVDVENVRMNYPNAANMHQSSMPSMNDDEGSIAIVNSHEQIIDAVRYYAGMHSVFVRDEEGVSLERISAEESSNRRENWKSASGLVGFATPGLRNSNALSDMSTDEVSIVPEVFVPRFGQPDFTTISFSLGQPGFMANIRVIDSRGTIIKTIAHNELLGTGSFLRWDGDREDGTPARLGAYMVAIELFNAEGIVKTIRKRVVIASH